MALESEILVTNYGIPSEFAESLLHFTRGDLEGAIRILEATEKDVLAVKSKFISSKKMTNGSLIFFFNYQTNLPEFVFCVVSSDQNLGKTKLENPWSVFMDDMRRFMSAAESEPESASRIESQILSADNVKYLTNFFLDRSNLDMVNLKRFLVSEISKVMMDTGIVIKIAIEPVDVFRFKSWINQSKAGLKIVAQNTFQHGMIINVKLDPVLSPIGGMDVEKIQIDDLVLARFVDDRPIVQYVADLCQPRDEAAGAVYGRVVRNIKSLDTSNLILTLEFGPGIYGSFIMGGKVKVQSMPGNQKKKDQETRESKQTQVQQAQAFQSLPPDDSEGNRRVTVKKNGSVLFIVIGVLAVAFLAIIVVMLFL
jgi:hypothetical protein